MPLRRFIDGDEDDRNDHETRGRLREIQAGLVAWQQAVDRRYHRVTRLLLVMMIAAFVAVLLGYALLQGQRWDSIRDGCIRTNQQAEATAGLLRDLKVREQVVLLAEARYPHTPPLAHREGATIVPGPPRDYDGPMTCDEFASENVGPFRL